MTEPQRDRELAEKIDRWLYEQRQFISSGTLEAFTELIQQHLAPERAAKDKQLSDMTKERDCWIETAKNLQEGYNKQDAKIERLKADCAVKDEALRTLIDRVKTLRHNNTKGITDYFNGIVYVDSMEQLEKALSTNPGAKLLEELAELRKAAQNLLRDDSPHPIDETANTLIEAVQVLLNEKNYDGEHHERFAIARNYASLIPNAAMFLRQALKAGDK